MWLNYVLSISISILSGLGIYIYFVSKKDGYRFFFPALTLFALFGIIPILFSIYISFTNLKTGHLLERSKVLEIFSSEKMIVENSFLLSYQIIKYPDSYLLVVDNLSGNFKLDDHKVVLGPTTRLPINGSRLSVREIMNLIERKMNLDIIHPGLGLYHFYRSDLLAQTKPRYHRVANTFVDNLTGGILVEDKNEGQFKLGEESIGPGYFTWVGLKNYRDIFLDPNTKFVFLKIFLWTLSWAGLSVLFTFSLGTFLAVILNDLNGNLKFIYRMIFIIPYSIPFFISVLIFKGMLNKDFGEINHLLGLFSISPVPWLESKIWARVSALLVNLWLGFPYMFLVITGVLQSIPKSIYEASSLEGASKWQNFRFLTFPLVLRSIIPLLIGSFAFNLNNFVGIYLLTGGGPGVLDAKTPLGETDILISYTYRLAFEGEMGQNFSMAATVSMLIFMLVLGLTFLNFKASKKLSHQ